MVISNRQSCDRAIKGLYGKGSFRDDEGLIPPRKKYHFLLRKRSERFYLHFIKINVVALWEICQALINLWNRSLLTNGRLKDTPIFDACGPLGTLKFKEENGLSTDGVFISSDCQWCL